MTNQQEQAIRDRVGYAEPGQRVCRHCKHYGFDHVPAPLYWPVPLIMISVCNVDPEGSFQVSPRGSCPSFSPKEKT